MAVVSITTDVTRQNDLDTTASISSIGGGPGGSILSSIVYQGTGAALRRVNKDNTDYGFTITEGTTRDTTTAAFRTFGFKGWISDFGNLNPAGLRLRLGSAGTAYHLWIMGDDGTIPSAGFEYPAKGGFVINFVDATLRAWLESTTGNPDETAIDEYTCTANISATSNGENLSFDALDWVENGFYLVGGDGGDTDGTFQDFVDEDEGEGSATVDRCGLWQTVAGVIFFYGTHSIGVNASGTPTATEFTDSFKTLVCPGGFVRDGFNALDFDITNASTTVSLSNITLFGAGRFGNKRLFSAINETSDGDVDTANDEINFTSHGFLTGDQILYSQELGTGTVVSLTGGESQLVTGTTGAYYYAINVSANVFAVATSRANALAGTRAALTAATGYHSFTRTPDTRPDFTVISDAAPGSMTISSCVLNGMREITLENGVTASNTQFVASQKLFLNEGTLDTCVINEPTVWYGEAFVDLIDDIETISDCTFIAGSNGGHAIELDGYAGSPYSFSGNTFTDYGPDAELGNGHSFDTTDGVGVDSTNDEINYTSHQFTTGDPVFYSVYDPTDGTLGTDSIGLTDGELYFVRSVDANNFSLHTSSVGATNDTNQVTLNGTGTGETHTFYSANAAIVNNSGGDITINITGGGNTPSVRNIGASTTTIVNAVPIEINGLTEGSRVAVIGNGGAEDGVVIVEGYANSSGIVSGSFGGTTPQSVIIRTRNGGIINAAIQDDGAVFTDFTLEARTLTDSPGTGVTDDVDLLPATPATNDAFYFGGLALFSQVELNITTAGSGYSGTWEYWNGAWVSLTVTDETNSFQTSGNGLLVSFTRPSNWVTTSVNSQGPFYYIRFRVTSVTAPTQAQADSISLDKTTKYIPFNGAGTITSSGLTATAVWQVDTNNTI